MVRYRDINTYWYKVVKRHTGTKLYNGTLHTGTMTRYRDITSYRYRVVHWHVTERHHYILVQSGTMTRYVVVQWHATGTSFHTGTEWYNGTLHTGTKWCNDALHTGTKWCNDALQTHHSILVWCTHTLGHGNMNEVYTLVCLHIATWTQRLTDNIRWYTLC